MSSDKTKQIDNNPSDSNELVAVVDPNGKTIKKVRRSQLTDEYTWKIICVWIENSKGQVLLQQRSLKKRLGPGLWTCAVEGTVENDDSYLDTATREVQEEIGLDDFKLIKAKQVLYKAGVGSRLAQGYRIYCDWPIEKFKAQPEEVEQLQWVDKKTVVEGMKQGDPKYPISAKGWLTMFDLV